MVSGRVLLCLMGIALLSAGPAAALTVTISDGTGWSVTLPNAAHPVQHSGTTSIIELAGTPYGVFSITNCQAGTGCAGKARVQTDWPADALRVLQHRFSKFLDRLAGTVI